MPSIAEFRAYFPNAFPAVDDATLQRTINESLLIHSASEEANLYLIAHLLAMQTEWADTPDGGAGVVVKESIGPRSIDYATLAGSGSSTDMYKSFFAGSAYGRMFLILEQRTPRTGIAAMVVP